MSLPLSFTWRARRPSRAPREIPPEGCVGLVRASPERSCAARRGPARRLPEFERLRCSRRQRATGSRSVGSTAAPSRHLTSLVLREE